MTDHSVTASEICAAESAVLGDGRKYNDDQLNYLRCLQSCSVQAYAGTGKTSVIVGKLHVLAQRSSWRDGRGVCVLSHTNVAVDEIKRNVAKDYPEVMHYPNYVGTIQEFANKFFFIPFLASKGLKIKFQGDSHFIDLKSLPGKISQRIDRHMRSRIANSPNPDGAKEDFFKKLKTLHLVNGKVCFDNDCGGAEFTDIVTKEVPQAEINAAFRDYIQVRQKEGYFLYLESFIAAAEYLSANPTVKDIVAKRFKYVFLDEAQDCSQLQLALIDKLFSEASGTVFQAVGDKNQAISQDAWTVRKDSLNIGVSPRFGAEAAEFVGNYKITSGPGLSGTGPFRKHFLVTYDTGKEGSILPAYAELVRKEQIPYEKGFFAVSHRHMELAKYFSDYSECLARNGVRKGNYRFETDIEYISLLTKELVVKNGGSGISKVLLQLLFKHRKALGDSFGEMLRDIRNTSKSQVFHELVCRVSKELLSRAGYLDLKGLEMTLNALLEGDFVSLASGKVLSKPKIGDTQSLTNIFTFNGVAVSVGTIHSVKGQTHDATLMFSNSFMRKQDFQHAIDNTGKMGPMFKKLIYVAASRPKHLFAIAIEKAAYNRLSKKDFFKGFAELSV